MAAFLALVLALTLAPRRLAAQNTTNVTTIVLSVVDQFGTNWNNSVAFQPVQPLLQDGTNLVVLRGFTMWASNGVVRTNVHPADYIVQVEGVPHTFKASVPQTNVVWQILLGATNLLTYVYTNPLPNLTPNWTPGGGLQGATNGFTVTGYLDTNAALSLGTNVVTHNVWTNAVNVLATNVSLQNPAAASVLTNDSRNLLLTGGSNWFANTTMGSQFNMLGPVFEWVFNLSGGNMTVMTNTAPAPIVTFGTDYSVSAGKIVANGSSSGFVGNGALITNLSVNANQLNAAAAVRVVTGALVTNTVHYPNTNTAFIVGAGDPVYNQTFYFIFNTNTSFFSGADAPGTKAVYTNASNGRQLIADSVENIWFLATNVNALVASSGVYFGDYTSATLDINSAWITQADTAPAPSQHYFQAAVDARGMLAGNGALLTNLQATAVVGALLPAQMQYASTNLDGIVKSNLYALNQMAAGQQANMERTPLRGTWIYGGAPPANPLESAVSNYIVWNNSIPANGFNVIGTDLGLWLYSNNVIIMNFSNFPSGPTGYPQLLHTNGYRWMAWYDPGHIPVYTGFGSVPPSTEAQKIADLKSIVALGVDILWNETFGTTASWQNQLLAIVTNNNVQLMGAFTTANMTNMASSQMLQYVSSFRVHDASDIVSWSSALDYCNDMEKWVRKYVGPGHAPWPGYIAGGFGSTGQRSFLVMSSMFSGCLIEPFSAGSNAFYGPFGDYTFMTNNQLREVQMDPAMVPGRRAYVTNTSWVLVKPLKTANGPNFAVCVVNTNTTGANQTVNLAWQELNKGLGALQSGLQLTDPTYSVFDMKANAAVGEAQSGISVTLAPQDYALLKLTSTNVILAGDASRVTGLPLSSVTSPGAVLTNGESLSTTFSNALAVDATHSLKANNATASSVAALDGGSQLTNAQLNAAFTFTANSLALASTVTNIANISTPGLILTNGESQSTTFSNALAVDATHSLKLNNATASRVAMLDGASQVTNASASGASPINSDGTATTFVQVNSLAPGVVLTNGESQSVTFSNQTAVNATHAFVANNASASALAGFDGAHNLTNVNVDATLSFSGNTLSVVGGGGGIPTLNGNGTNTTLYFNTAQWGTNNIVNQNSTGAAVLSGSGNSINVINSPGSFIAGGLSNTISVLSTYCIVDGGESNSMLGGVTTAAVIAGGLNNSMTSGGNDKSVIGGGWNNVVTLGVDGVIAGGCFNLLSGASNCVIGGGITNFIVSSTSYDSIIAGGASNILSASQWATISGGANNFIQVSSTGGVIAGGDGNTVTSGIDSIVLAGTNNTASAKRTIAGGTRAKAANAGALVLTDSQEADQSSSTTDEATLRYQNGIRLIGPVGYQEFELNKTANYTLLTTDAGKRVNNGSAAGTVTNTLPAANVGMHFSFTIVASQNVTVQAVGTDTIRNLASVSASGGFVFSGTAGNSFHLYCPVAGQWFMESVQGTWTVH